MATHFRRRTVRAPLPLLALLALALTLPVHEASAQWPPPQPPPVPRTLPATDVTSSSATLNGSVYPNSGGGVWFEWGINTTYGNETSSIQVGPGTNAVPFSAPLLWLSPNTTYHFRADGEGFGPIFMYGDDQSFTTLPGPVQPQFTFTTNNGTITITGYYGPVAMTIPSTITGLPVTRIGDSAFYCYSSLTSVTIPDSVIDIGDKAFEGCRSLTKVTIGRGVSSIGDYTFYNCSLLTNVTIGDSVAGIGIYAFAYCPSLTGITIPDSVTNIGGRAFEDCFGLINVTIPDSVTCIRDHTFYYCTSLTNVTIGSGVTSIADQAFDDCSSLTSITIPDSVTSIGNDVFLYCTSLANVTIGRGVTSIGDHAFNYCTSLTTITVDALNPLFCSLEGILFDKSQTALIQCPGRKAGSYTIPDSVSSIGNDAFFECTRLTNVTIGNGVTSIGDSAFYYCTSLTGVAIPNTVTSIGDYAFRECSSLTIVTIGNRVTSIGQEAFTFCSRLTNLTIGNGVTSIGNNAFNGCTSLSSVTIPDSVTSIGFDAFGGCTYLTGVTIGKGVIGIGDYAFSYCQSLTALHFGGNAPGLGGPSVFTGDPSATVYYLPGTTGWGSSFGGLPTALWQSPLPGAWTLSASTITTTGATLNGTVNPNGYPATAWFQWGATTNYGNLTSATGMGSGTSALPLSAPLAGLAPGITYHYRVAATNSNGAVYGSDQSFTTASLLPPQVSTLPATRVSTNSATLNGTVNPNGYPATAWFQWSATTNYGNLTSATGMGSGTSALALWVPLAGLAPGITYHYRVAATNSNGAVYGSDQSFTTLPGPVQPQFTFTTNNGAITITGCYGPAAVTIPSTITGLPVTSIGDHAFYQCTNLNSVTIPDSVTSIGDYAFQYCTSLTNATIGNGVTSIGEYAFYECGSLTSITIPDSVTRIGNDTFQYCTSLTNVTIGNGVTSIGDDAFVECTSLTALHFGGNAPGLGGSFVFYGDTNATVYYLPGTTGWGTTFGGCPTALWFLPNPLILTSGPGFGAQSNAFGFTISWATNLPVVVEACTNPANHSWSPLKTNALTGGWSYFSDPQWANYPARFYRLRQP